MRRDYQVGQFTMSPLLNHPEYIVCSNSWPHGDQEIGCWLLLLACVCVFYVAYIYIYYLLCTYFIYLHITPSPRRCFLMNHPADTRTNRSTRLIWLRNAWKAQDTQTHTHTLKTCMLHARFMRNANTHKHSHEVPKKYTIRIRYTYTICIRIVCICWECYRVILAVAL